MSTIRIVPVFYLQFKGDYAIVEVIEDVLLFDLEEPVNKG
jgi:hypothetical protein